MKIINISDVFEQEWRWIEPSLDKKYKWLFLNSKPKNIIEKYFRKPSLSRIRAILQGLFSAKDDDVFVIHGPYLAFYHGFFSKLMGKKNTSIIYSFNFTSLPNGFSRTRMKYAFKYFDRFVVYSAMEKELYSSWFSIPEDKIDMILWGVNKPLISDEAIIKEPYITAVGGNSRDYDTLMAAMNMIPEIKLVAVMRPENLKGLVVPDNIEIRTNITLEDANNIIGHAKFMVLPLVGNEIPCGHVTLVAAMHMAVPSITTSSTGLDDYVTNGINALLVESGDVISLANNIKRLWTEDELRERLSENSKSFAESKCTEKFIVKHFNDYLST